MAMLKGCSQPKLVCKGTRRQRHSIFDTVNTVNELLFVLGMIHVRHAIYVHKSSSNSNTMYSPLPSRVSRFKISAKQLSDPNTTAPIAYQKVRSISNILHRLIIVELHVCTTLSLLLLSLPPAHQQVPDRT